MKISRVTKKQKKLNKEAGTIHNEKTTLKKLTLFTKPIDGDLNGYCSGK